MADKAHILIVDDNVSQCKTMSMIFRHKGHTVTTANDGLEAIAHVQERPFDMIFMDIKMPVMNGVETFRRIKEIRPTAVTVMMTAYALEELVQQALEEGVYKIVYKPLDIEQAIALVEETRRVKTGALILVVDDDPGTCIILREILTKKGFDVRIAHTGEAALGLVQQTHYDIIMIDMKLPLLNGLETYLAMREIDPAAVVVLMTAYRQEMAAMVEEAVRNHAYTCFYKPLDIENLLALVEEILGRKRRLAAVV